MKKLIATVALIGLLCLPVLGGEVNMPPEPPAPTLIAQILNLLFG